MVDVEALSLEAMEIVTYAGGAKSSYIQALKLAKKKDYVASKVSVKTGDEMMSKAHKKHFGLLKKEAETMEAQVSLMILHAEDQLMSCETIKLVVTELIELYQERK